MSLPPHGLGRRTTAVQALRGISLAGKTAVVTGANAGIGVETARVLALAGARVIMACRNVAGAEAVAARLRAALTQNAGALEVRAVDLGDLGSVRAFARAFAARHERLHLLVNNAGVMATPLGQTVDGFELQVGINHLGHFLLTSLLRGQLEASAPARVVVVASQAHRRGTRDSLLATLETDPQYQRRKYLPFVAYGDSKLANILFAKALARRLAGTGVLPLSLHPGVIPTGLTQHMGLTGKMFRAMGPVPLFFKSVEAGAATTIFAATAPELTEAHAGSYLSNCNEAQPRAAALDTELAERVWALSEAAVSRA